MLGKSVEAGTSVISVEINDHGGDPRRQFLSLDGGEVPAYLRAQSRSRVGRCGFRLLRDSHQLSAAHLIGKISAGLPQLANGGGSIRVPSLRGMIDDRRARYVRDIPAESS